MRNRELSRQLDVLRHVLDGVDAACGGDFEMRSHWARYVCILSAGFLENALKEVYTDFIRGAAQKPVADYASSVLSGVQNPKTPKFLETAGRFKADWADELKTFTDSNGRGDAINSIMNVRNQVAHGKNSGITLVQVRTYLEKAIEVIEFIETQCAR